MGTNGILLVDRTIMDEAADYIMIVQWLLPLFHRGIMGSY